MPRPPVTRANPYTPRSGVVAGQTFASEREYRNALARAKGFRSWSEQQRHPRAPRADAPPKPAELGAARRAFDAINEMRTEGLSLSAAARAAGTTANAVKRHAGSALRRSEGGRYRPTPFDRLGRPMLMPTPDGTVSLTVRDSRSASKLGEYSAAVRHYLNTGDAGRLKKFRSQGITVNKRFYPFVTDTDLLDPLADAGELDFDDLYDLGRAA